MEDIKKIISEAQQGNLENFGAIYEFYRAKGINIAKQYVKTQEDAEDMYQDAFMKAMEHISSFDTSKEFGPWLDVIIVNTCKNYLVKKKPTNFSDISDDETEFVDVLENKDAEIVPESAYDRKELMSIMGGIINDLPQAQKEAVVLYYYKEMSVKQIAEYQEVPEDTIKSRLNYSRKKVSAAVEAFEKKNGIKIHSIVIVPVLMSLFFKNTAKAAYSESVLSAGIGGLSGPSKGGSALKNAKDTEKSKSAAEQVVKETAKEMPKTATDGVASDATKEAAKETAKKVAETAGDVAGKAAGTTIGAATHFVARFMKDKAFRTMVLKVLCALLVLLLIANIVKPKAEKPKSSVPDNPTTTSEEKKEEEKKEEEKKEEEKKEEEKKEEDKKKEEEKKEEKTEESKEQEPADPTKGYEGSLFLHDYYVITYGQIAGVEKTRKGTLLVRWKDIDVYVSDDYYLDNKDELDKLGKWTLEEVSDGFFDDVGYGSDAYYLNYKNVTSVISEGAKIKYYPDPSVRESVTVTPEEIMKNGIDSYTDAHMEVYANNGIVKGMSEIFFTE